MITHFMFCSCNYCYALCTEIRLKKKWAEAVQRERIKYFCLERMQKKLSAKLIKVLFHSFSIKFDVERGKKWHNFQQIL